MIRRNSRSGGALLITIGVVASLVAIVLTATSTEQVTLRAISNRTAARRARMMAESGIQQAIATLASQSTSQTTQQDDWYQLGQTGATRYVVGRDSFRIQIVDAASLINVNTAPEAQLDRLPLTQEQIDSLLDWRTGGETPRADGGKDDYYNNLSTPYNAKLGALTSLDELLLVKGFTPKTLYEPQTDTFSTDPLPSKADGTQYTLYDLCTVDSVSSIGAGGGGGTGGAGGGGGGRLPNINTITQANQLTSRGISAAVATRIIAGRGRWTTYNALLGIPGMRIQDARILVDDFSISNAATASGKIDINTASDAVLESIPNMQPDIANAIVTQQGTGFTSLGDLFNVAGFQLAIARETLDSFTTNSQTFIVHSMGSAGDARCSLDALLSISANGAKILKITQLPYADMSKRWGWDDQTTTDNVLLEDATQQ
ncbi:MAG TPA: type II secretion system protein GspK [Fimbriimonadaceae bacterium]|nr:type II secretion system protein GspK [Fimbriimonadaceae bacterium]